MLTLKNNEYIVFQPDQVLTNDHLNQLFYYLDRQNRLTRNKLIGMGIVCGFELVATLINQRSLSTIEIKKGCGLSSEGYLLVDCTDHVYTHAILYTPPTLPPDLPFNCKTIPFYNYPQQKRGMNGAIYSLMTCTQYDNYVAAGNNPVTADNPCGPASISSPLIPDSPLFSPPGSPVQPQPFPLSSPPVGTNFFEYAVVLFLEVSEKDLRNCDMQDCNNKGEKMVFRLRPLLVPKKYLPNFCGDKNTNLRAPEIQLKRYNVLYQDIDGTAAVLDAFKEIFSNNILSEISDAYSYCYEQYKDLLTDQTNPFISTGSPPDSLLDKLKAALNGIWNNSNKITIQYFYDYINDLVLAYYEFRELASVINMQCCGDECAFPLHLTLGEATSSTEDWVKDCWRQYFIYSPLFDQDNKSLARLRFYFHRMKILADSDIFPLKLPFTTRDIRITPSQYQEFPLSKRAIPYYYPEDAQDPDSLFRFWNFEKTMRGNAVFNLSYNAHIYNQYDLITNNPLEYDIEPYHFFRIEGHIGLPYNGVLERILNLRKNYNLPFDVVAVSAELLDPSRAGSIPPCIIQDLETDLRVLLIEFLCKLFLCIYRLSYLPYDAANRTSVIAPKIALADLPLPDAAKFTAAFQFEFGKYQPGDFMANFKPDAKTIGQAYLDTIKIQPAPDSADFSFVREKNQLISVNIFNSIFSLFNVSDALFNFLFNTKIQDITASAFTRLRENFDQQYLNLQTLVKSAEAAEFVKTTGLSISILKGCDCLICIAESILVILLEYLRRIKLYESQLEFLYYYQKHPGLEHKSGVPKGGTFVLVYHQEAAIVKQRIPSTTGAVLAVRSDTTGNVAETTDTATLTELSNVLKEHNIYSSDIMNRVAGVLKGFQPAQKVFPITDGVVIADFYVPYLCCSDCSPVAYILPSDTTSKTAFDIKVSTFLYDDPNSYPFTAEPAVTQLSQVTNPDNLRLAIENNILKLYPAMDGTGGGTAITATLEAASLTYQGITIQPIRIIKPDASFTITLTRSNTPAGAVTIQMQLAAVIVDNLAAYAWTLNNDTTKIQPLANPAAITIPSNQDKFTISLTVTYNLNSVTSKDTKTTVLTGARIKSSLDKGTFTPVFK